MNFLKRIKKNLDFKTKDFEHQFLFFGICGVINYPLYWFIWKFYSIQGYENLALRITATCLCIPLIFFKYWSANLKNWASIYWYATLTFCLPFFFTFMTLKNQVSPIWMMSLISIMFWLILLVDWLSFIIILFIGSILGVSLFMFLNEQLPVADYHGIIIQAVGTLLGGVILANNKANVEQEKLLVMKSLGATVAHELRTPLTTIQFSMGGTKNYLPKLVEAYEMAKSHGLKVHPIQSQHLAILSNAFDNIESELQYADAIINMILMNTKERIAKTELRVLSIQTCIADALRRYPFKAKQANLVHVKTKPDFLFYGDSMSIVHLLFNLIKNALYFIEAAGKGNIEIWAEVGEKYHTLHFKDTGKGISSNAIPKLFDKFYTTTRHGTGLGLAYCKKVMSSLGGKIDCQSKEGEFAEFIMTFPASPKHEENE